MQALWQRSSPARRVERWLWTGPVGHLIGGLLDVGQAWLGYRRARR